MAIRYHLPNGSDTDMVINSLQFFPVATGQEFRDLFLAVAASPPNAPRPTQLDQFAAAHPALGPSATQSLRPGLLWFVSVALAFDAALLYKLDDPERKAMTFVAHDILRKMWTSEPACEEGRTRIRSSGSRTN